MTGAWLNDRGKRTQQFCCDCQVSIRLTETAIQGALTEIKDRYWDGTGTQWEDKDCLVLSAILLRNFPSTAPLLDLLRNYRDGHKVGIQECYLNPEQGDYRCDLCKAVDDLTLAG